MIKKYFTNYFLAISVLFLMATPLLGFAQITGGGGPQNTGTETTVKGGTNNGITYECNPPGSCDFNDLIGAVKKVLDWAIKFALEFSVIIIAIAGYKYMVSGDNPGERKEANKMLLNVVKGIAFVMAAWLIVTLITNTLLNGNVLNFFGK